MRHTPGRNDEKKVRRLAIEVQTFGQTEIVAGATVSLKSGTLAAQFDDGRLMRWDTGSKVWV